MEESNEGKTFPFKCPFCNGEMLVEEENQDLVVNCPYCGKEIVPTRETPDLFPPSGNVKKQKEERQNPSEEYLMWKQQEAKRILEQKQWEKKRPERNFATLKSYTDYEIPKKKSGIPPLSSILIFSGAIELFVAFGFFIAAVNSKGPEETRFYLYFTGAFILTAIFLFGVADILNRFYVLVDNSYHIIYLLEKMTKTPSEQKPDKK